ncbi:MAG TPA: HEAT repeat domain-containing protein [Urbifossiella sp.]|nr:HEAT repeat domain-containing protein [Urbifossiella sp.]
MSIPVLTQVYAEARRLAVAGSVVAKGDFRLKKLIPPLEQAGAQAPVFAKVAEAATAVVDGPEANSAEALLELTALASAVLYTQGETGLAGPLEPIETTDLGGTTSQISARVLKPLLEALRGTGSGRVQPIKEAVEKGLFRDLRLIRPAVAAIDDGYAEVGELIADKVLPMYGTAILPELRAKYDQKGTKGHPRRLKLMHRIDPAGTRELVKEALDKGGKDVKVAAISCLGAEPEDRDYLIDQSASKTGDVRQAAYHALAKLDHPDAVAVLAKAITGKDLNLATGAIVESKNPKLAVVLAAEIRTSADAFLKIKDKKKVSEAADRLTDLLNALPDTNSPELDTVLLDLFARRAEFAKVKGSGYSGSDVVESVVGQMADGSDAARKVLVAAHADLEPDQLQQAFEAGRWVLSSEQLYDTFSPYLLAKIDPKKKARDPAFAKLGAIVDGIDSDYYAYDWFDEGDEDEDDDDEDSWQSRRRAELAKKPAYDPRWLDVAVSLKNEDLVDALARPDHAGAQAFAKERFDAALKKAKSPNDVQGTVITMLRVGHTDAVDAFFAGVAKMGKKTPPYHLYWYSNMIPRLPAAAIPRLEQTLAGFSKEVAEAVGEEWQEKITKLKAKHAPPEPAA